MAKKNVSYQVIHDFKDLQDKNKVYRANDSYPTPANKKVSEKRLQELLSKDNRLGIQLISEVEEASESKNK